MKFLNSNYLIVIIAKFLNIRVPYMTRLSTIIPMVTAAQVKM